MRKMVILAVTALCSCFLTACQPVSENTINTTALEVTALEESSNSDVDNNKINTSRLDEENLESQGSVKSIEVKDIQKAMVRFQKGSIAVRKNLTTYFQDYPQKYIEAMAKLDDNESVFKFTTNAVFASGIEMTTRYLDNLSAIEFHGNELELRQSMEDDIYNSNSIYLITSINNMSNGNVDYDQMAEVIMEYLIYKPGWLLDSVAQINEYNKTMVIDLIADQIFQANEIEDMKYMDALERITEDEIGDNQDLYDRIYTALNTRYKDVENSGMNVVLTYSEDLEGDTFVLTPNWLPSLTPQGIMTLITNESNLVPNSIKVQSFKLFVENDETIITLDLSKELLETNSDYSSKESFYLFGNIINTYLEAYSADKILITVDDRSIKTDDRDYTDYQYFMDSE